MIKEQLNNNTMENDKEKTKRLSDGELAKLDDQYWSLTDTLVQYDHGMRSPQFRRFPKDQQETTRKQFEFMKYALNESIKVLIIHDFLSKVTAEHASGNRYVTLKTKWQILSYTKMKARK